MQLIGLSLKFPDLLDAKFSVIYSGDNELQDKLRDLNYLGSFMSIEEHLQYKYQILMDGNTASWPGSYWRLHSNSLVLKQDSEFIQWYYGLLKPYVNYVPFSRNLDNLLEKIQWAKDNDEQAQHIVKNANDMCAGCLTYADIMYYFYMVIDTYAELQKTSVHVS